MTAAARAHATLLTDAQLAAALAERPGWRLVGGTLQRRLRFRDFERAFAFLSAVARRAEAMQHHPDWRNVYARVEIRLTTFDAGGVTQRDLELADAIEAHVAEFGGRDDEGATGATGATATDGADAMHGADPAAHRYPREIPPLWFLSAMLLQLALHHALPIHRWLAPPWSLLGLLPIALGASLLGWGAATFRRTGTGIRPFSAVRALVTAGPFRVSRNPMYLGMVLVLAGVALCCGSLTPVVVVPAFGVLIARRFVRAEERFLTERLGDAYRDYCLRVPRWL